MVTSFYLLVRVWWVLFGMERDGTVVSREESGEDTEEDIEMPAEDKNGNTNGKHMDRYGGVDLLLINSSVSRISSVGSISITRNISTKKITIEDDLFVTKEKETQIFLFILLIVHVVFLLPLNIFK